MSRTQIKTIFNRVQKFSGQTHFTPTFAHTYNNRESMNQNTTLSLNLPIICLFFLEVERPRVARTHFSSYNLINVFSPIQDKIPTSQPFPFRFSFSILKKNKKFLNHYTFVSINSYEIYSAVLISIQIVTPGRKREHTSPYLWPSLLI